MLSLCTVNSKSTKFKGVYGMFVSTGEKLSGTPKTRLFFWVNRFGINQDGGRTTLSSLADFTQTMFHSHFAHVIFSGQDNQ